mmetsp:Transcript_11555/g.34029  ORF Transcript_11555/g.34029 Transcript_11555/m.34029 type:complete len:207 (+) Transcript_11555:358-978(+)
MASNATPPTTNTDAFTSSRACCMSGTKPSAPAARGAQTINASKPYLSSATPLSSLHLSTPSVSRFSVTASAPPTAARANWTSSTTASIQTMGSGPGKSSFAVACSATAASRSASSQPPATDSMLIAKTLAPAARNSSLTRVASGCSYSAALILRAAGTLRLYSATTPKAPRAFLFKIRRQLFFGPSCLIPSFIATATGWSSLKLSR